ncbi:hypothetical protein COW36_11560 [bacterium (Candidatus Blackallbacteria) CG17_big_fil_post_rev_8_21_14_2_50_48_46]|uniref:Initiator Rep protein domain-containing protein n=1 Tax=bacterium (Candidatus Blackallbacteria) CG17_big_fil_post_rev_8_21_14_2_50_48_46 TaxID=2014261 RepID=A0A2M7G4E3_9BACT|nr:MAG: hypothetical protein COW64_21780 [bacterium (Candidatus Blackallbacteria) CG18_big_fil_WC_8_21_14_2_50_49_26]PIW16774.1 MAG: hypothetical protein COW36_11560 [bacterium (Candidatus Blackallbacteria) CG17_big_fil_post_rev_8_21_14_2_50_48_46]PIW49566.1 MAG: hypothetical protein COW20_05480 [bacterium (Candidatus Blackallbacteria) CG13_big_fil_rev_8_21_14_2_50_49_14]
MKNVLKQDLNFLQYPLWFQVSHGHAPLVWNHPEGYTYRAAYRAPDQLDMLFLMYLLMRAQQENYKPRLEFSRYEILKGCGCPINPQYLKRLEDSLKRWLNVSLEYENCFFDGVRFLSAGFRLIENYRLREKDKRIEIRLSEPWLQQIQQSLYFKYLDFSYYKALRRPVSRRLFELLTTQFKSQSQWRLPLVELGHHLTLYSRRKINAEGLEERVIFPSDVLTALKSALQELNQLSSNAELLREMGMDPREIYGVTFEVQSHRKMIELNRVSLTHLFDALTYSPEPEKPEHAFAEPLLQELLSYLKRSSRPLQELVTQSYQSYGFEYVKWNIFYANRNGAKNYANYLKLCLQHNWAQEFREEYERMFASNEESLDSRKISALIKVAEQADYLTLQDGQKFKIKRVFPNGALEITNRNYKMDFVLSPAQAYACRFERDLPQTEPRRRGRPRKNS